MFLAAFVPFLLGFLIVGGVVFAVVGLGVSWLDEYGQPGKANSLVVGAAARLTFAHETVAGEFERLNAPLGAAPRRVV